MRYATTTAATKLAIPQIPAKPKPGKRNISANNSPMPKRTRMIVRIRNVVILFEVKGERLEVRGKEYAASPLHAFYLFAFRLG